jgi:hypothetical protein
MRIISDKALTGDGRFPAVREYRIVGLDTSATDPRRTYSFGSRE